MKLIVKKPSAMIQINVKGLTTMQRKIINSLVYMAQKNTGTNETFYEISTSMLKKICNIKSKDNDEIKKKLEELSNIIIKFNYLEKDTHHIWGSMALISEVQINDATGIIKYAFPPTINEQVIKPKIYSPLNIILISGLTNSYSIILYELFRDYIDAYKFPTLSIHELRELLSIEKNQYIRFQDFKKRVLNVAIREINEFTDINCAYELIKESGNCYSYINFKISKKKYDIYEDLENIRNENRVKQIEETSFILGMEISNTLKIPLGLIRNFFDIYGENRIKEVYDFVLKEKNVQKPAGLFISALTKKYEMSNNVDPQVLKIKMTPKDTINHFKKISYLCLTTLEDICPKNWEDIKKAGEGNYCFWCEKFKIERKNLTVQTG